MDMIDAQLANGVIAPELQRAIVGHRARARLDRDAGKPQGLAGTERDGKSRWAAAAQIVDDDGLVVAAGDGLTAGTQDRKVCRGRHR